MSDNNNNNPNTVSACKQVVNHLLSEVQIKNKKIKTLETQLSNYEKRMGFQLKNLNESWFKDYKKLSGEHRELEKEYDKLFSYCITIENELESYKDIHTLD